MMPVRARQYAPAAKARRPVWAQRLRRWPVRLILHGIIAIELLALLFISSHYS